MKSLFPLLCGLGLGLATSALAHEPTECICPPPPPPCAPDPIVQQAAAEAREAIRLSIRGPHP